MEICAPARKESGGSWRAAGAEPKGSDAFVLLASAGGAEIGGDPMVRSGRSHCRVEDWDDRAGSTSTSSPSDSDGSGRAS